MRTPYKLLWSIGMGVAVSALLVHSAVAHHGWSWSTAEEVDLSGTVLSAKLGNPHGEVMLNVDGEKWLVVMGNPARNAQAKLTVDLLPIGVTINVHGHRSAKHSELLFKAERVTINGKDYNLYPDRKS